MSGSVPDHSYRAQVRGKSCPQWQPVGQGQGMVRGRRFDREGHPDSGCGDAEEDQQVRLRPDEPSQGIYFRQAPVPAEVDPPDGRRDHEPEQRHECGRDASAGVQPAHCDDHRFTEHNDREQAVPFRDVRSVVRALGRQEHDDRCRDQQQHRNAPDDRPQAVVPPAARTTCGHLLRRPRGTAPPLQRRPADQRSTLAARAASTACATPVAEAGF